MQPKNNLPVFDIRDNCGKYVSGFEEDGSFHGDVKLKVKLSFPDGTEMTSAGVGVPSGSIDAGEF